MHVYVLTKDSLEAQGIKWMITSQLREVFVETGDSISKYRKDMHSRESDFYVIDMDLWSVPEEILLPSGAMWLGLSSDRTFQTTYRALQHKAEDLLFRPFQPEHLIKHIHQARFRLRNEKKKTPQLDSVPNAHFTYEDLLLAETYPSTPLLLSAIVPANRAQGTQLVQALEEFAFPSQVELFPFTDFILVIHRLTVQESLQEAYLAFYASWKRQSHTLLSIYLYESHGELDIRSLYQKMRRFQERIFYDGYDILSVETEDLTWRGMDPFLSPIEQRMWIEMLGKQDVKAIRQWLEQDFLTLEAPYPDPEMVRIRLTSVLAQIRRYMSANSIQNGPLEKQYHQLFQDIVREPVMYHIIQNFGDFTANLMKETSLVESGTSNFSDKVRTMMESNYWDSNWNLAACAEVLQMNKSTLSRRFSKSTGKKFRETLQEIRIGEAKRLLKETNASLEEVSRLAGFTHQSYFNTKFRASTGQTPSQYRFN
ncbi:helix-turn-helix transcriptional regulator [Paenisporosarcina sp.]|uniref:helix-turn-helix transcriptional regulator n=1 Tax=Paenisporosarcina sp. TaxID=1932001 RepID=UPI003C73560F